MKDYVLNFFVQLGHVVKFEKNKLGTVVYFKDGTIGLGQNFSNASKYYVDMDGVTTRCLNLKNGKITNHPTKVA